MSIEIIEHERTPDGLAWENQSGVETRVVAPYVDRVSREIANWVSSTRGARPSILNRSAYVTPENPYAQMATAKSAVDNDDIVGGVADVHEALMLQGVKWEAESAESADVFNQLSRDLNLDQVVRQWAREEFTHSQVIMGLWWGRKTYVYRGKTAAGKASKKTFDIVAPIATTFLDPQKIFPLRPGPFGQERLAWHATDEEYAVGCLRDPYADPLLYEFTNGPATITDKAEIDYITSCGMDYRRLLLINPATVIRYSRTKMPYERFPQIRLKSVFPLLDLKQQLMEADRVNLVGAANFILLVKQGTEQSPAKQEEIDNLKENFKVVAKLPVVIGDHRLNIEIITPDQEHVLDGTKYDTIDRRIMNRVLGSLSIGGSGQRNESTVTVARGVARLLENRRHMMKRALEETIARQICEHPANAGKFEHEPNLTFTPRNVQLDSDSEVARAIISLRTQNELSRESVLEYFGFDQAVEALRREFEEETYDDIFKTRVPFDGSGGDGDGAEPSTVSGARGGRPAGGGDSAQSPEGQTGGRNSRGQKTPKS